MDWTATTTSGLATPPLPASAPLVYITGSPTANKQCVAECLALLLGDNAILVDQPHTSTHTPPPPSSTPPDPTSDLPAPSSRSRRPKGLRLPSSASYRSRRSSSSATSSSSSSPNPLLATLTSHPTEVAILTDLHRSSSTSASPQQAALLTARPFVRVRLGAQPSPDLLPSSEEQEQEQEVAVTTLVLPDEDDPPHAVALRIAEFVREINARRRSSGWEELEGKRDGVGWGDCVCGVITPVLTPAEESSGMRF